MVCMSYITLLGDSIIDNKTYVRKGELSVLEHLENISEYEYTQLAFDGDTTLNVLNGQLLSPAIATSSHLVLSIGGNDLLQNLSFLYEGPVDKINDLYFSKGMGALGCYLSHYVFWKYVVSEKLEYALVLEIKFGFLMFSTNDMPSSCLGFSISNKSQIVGYKSISSAKLSDFP